MKQFTSLASAAFFGLWLGVTYVGNIAFKPLATGDAPVWVGAAKEMQALAIVGLMVCVAGWMLLDWREHNASD